MNISKESVMATGSVMIKNSQALIEGALKLPDGMERIESLLALEGIARVESVLVEEGRVIVEGTVKYNIVYIDLNSEICAFDSGCNFRHVADNSSLDSDMQAFCDILLQDTDSKVMDGLSIGIKSVISIDICAIKNSEFEVVDNIISDNAMEVLREDIELPCLKSGKVIKSNIKEEIRVPQSMPPVKQVLLTKAYPIILEVHNEAEQVAIEGEMRLTIVYLSADKNAPLHVINETISFAEIINEPACSSESKVWARAQMEQISIEMAGHDEDILNVFGTIGIKVFCFSSKKISIIKDLYSKNKEYNLIKNTINTEMKRRCPTQKKILRLDMIIPNYAPEVSRVLFACGNAQITSVCPGKDMLKIAGALTISICYSTPESGIKSYKTALPFETELMLEGILSNSGMNFSANVEYVCVEGSGRELDVKCCFEVDIDEIKRQCISAICNIEEKECETSHNSGIVIYVADGRESLWDIAKNFRVNMNSILSTNKGIKEGSIEKNTKLVIVT